MVIPFALPMNVIVPNEGEVKPADKVLCAAFNEDNYYNHADYYKSYNNLSLTLNVDNYRHKLEWVGQLLVNDNIHDRGFYFPLHNVKYGSQRNLKYIEIIAFVDRVFPSFLNKFKFVQEGCVFFQ